MIPLSATDMATRAFPEKHPQIHTSHYRLLDKLTISSIGFGTRLGRSDDETDENIMKALAAYLHWGGNCIDTAASDRGGRSERAVGRTIAQELSTGRLARREVVIAGKAGFIGGQRLDADIADEGDIAGGIHCMSPRFLKHQLARSRENLQLETIDVYYLHNPEAQAAYIDRDELMLRIARAIEFLEGAASDGFIRRYGIATWSAFRTQPEQPDHLELAEMVRLAEATAGSQHHFRVIQLPYSAAMPAAAFSATQQVYGHRMSILEAAHQLGIDVIVAMPLMEGRLANELPPSFHHAFPRFRSDAQRALDFVVSTPWVASALVGMKDIAHVEENMEILREPALSSLTWAAEVDQLQD